MNRVLASLILTCAIWLFVPLTASAVTIDFVPVGNPGNGAGSAAMSDGTSGNGSVPYVGDPEHKPSFIGFRVASIQVPPPVAAWTGASSTAFADSGNWIGAVPGAIASTQNSDTVLFNQNAPNSPLAIDAGRNVKNITFDTANVDSLTIGALVGPALLLTGGGTIQTTSTVVSSQTVDSPLVLEGNYTFTSGASSGSRATLNFGGGITPGATSGTTTLTLNAGNTGANTLSGVLADNGSGQLAVTVNGTGLWILSGANAYSGGTTINSGTLMTPDSGAPVPFNSLGQIVRDAGALITTDGGALGVGPLTINAANNITSVLNLGSDQFISSVTINQSGTGSATVNVSAGATLTSTGALTTTGTFNSAGPGTLEMDAAPTLNDNSHLNLTGGTLRFSAKQGAATIGTGVTVTIATGATLELSGSVATLSSGAHRAAIVNNSRQDSGGMLLVSGANQQVGAIDGTGDTVINKGSDLTADHIIQNALVIGGTADNPGRLTIAPSDSSGNPLEQSSQQNRSILTGLLASDDPFSVGIGSANLLNGSTTNDQSIAAMSVGGSIRGGALATVPEPSTVWLCAFALIYLIGGGIWRLRNNCRAV